MISNRTRKTARVIVASLGMLLSVSAVAESRSVTYKYGDKVDVIKVLSISAKDGSGCKPVDHRMEYIDSAGKKQVLNYRALPKRCHKGR